METSLALTIIGSILILVGVIFNVIPKVVNQKTMGDLAEEAVNPAAALRTDKSLYKTLVIKGVQISVTQFRTNQIFQLTPVE